MVRIAILVLLFCLSGLSYAQQREFTTGVSKSMSIDEARREAFREAQPWVDVSGFPTVDPNLLANRQQIQKGGGKVGDRVITVFKDGGYAVHLLEEERLYSFASQYYASNGVLMAIEFDVGNSYPSKSYKHAAVNLYPLKKGDLIGVGLHVSGQESYMFKPNGILTTHWLGDKCYQADGSSCGTRRAFIAAGD